MLRAHLASGCQKTAGLQATVVGPSLKQSVLVDRRLETVANERQPGILIAAHHIRDVERGGVRRFEGPCRTEDSWIYSTVKVFSMPFSPGLGTSAIQA